MREDIEQGFFGPANAPVFGLGALVYFRSLGQIDARLGVDDRKKLCSSITAVLATSRKHANADAGPMFGLKLSKVIKEAASLLDRFHSWKKKVIVNTEILGGEPAFPRSRLSIRHVGELILRGALAEAREDYPYLSEEDFELARIYTAAYPKLVRDRASKEIAPAAARTR